MSRSVPIKWRAIIILTLMVLAISMEWYWIWGVLMISWAASEVRRGKFYLGEELDRKNDPLFFWLAVVIISLIGIYWLLYLFEV